MKILLINIIININNANFIIVLITFFVRLYICLLFVLFFRASYAQSPVVSSADDKDALVKKALDVLLKELDIQHHISIQPGSPIVLTYAYNFEYPFLENRLRVYLGPRVSAFQKQDRLLFNGGGNLGLSYYPWKGKGPSLRMEYTGMHVRHTPDTLQERPVGYKGEVLVGLGYELRISGLLYAQLGILRVLPLYGQSPLRHNPWDISFSLRMDLPFIDLYKENLDIPASKIDLSRFLKLGTSINLVSGASLGLEAAPSLLHKWGKRQQGQVGLSGLIRYLPSSDQRDWLYGGRCSLRYQLHKHQPYYFQCEWESLNGAYELVGTKTLGRGWSHSGLLGMGYGVSLGDELSFSIQIFRRVRIVNDLSLNPWDVRFSYRLPWDI